MPANETRRALVQTLREVLKAFPSSLSRLPNDPDVLQAQRAVGVLDKALERISERLR